MRVSKPWLAVTCVLVLFIWGNSLVPGGSSGSLSLAVADLIRSALESLHLPGAWVTNFVVRKTAHFTEYAVLGICASQAVYAGRGAPRCAFAALALFLVAVPTIDETIQLFVDGRVGQVADVLLDCCGAATGVALAYLVVSHLHRVPPADGDTADAPGDLDAADGLDVPGNPDTSGQFDAPGQSKASGGFDASEQHDVPGDSDAQDGSTRIS